MKHMGTYALVRKNCVLIKLINKMIQIQDAREQEIKYVKEKYLEY